MRTVFAVHFTREAIGDLRSYSKRDRRRVMDEIESSLKYEPDREARNNKRLRPNRLAEWELRVDRFRVFYDVSGEKRTVKIEAVGHKRGNRLYLRGEEFEL
jgi:mRNA-degrading endonuclease RelE of RelBE toxin-antitoxin system